mmetsp:Transcript_95096/g.264460  ORF Transcript_95096/g.264460 Transcript_95096/m.264460 type:complete len:244 (-) Transcript_95096:826-1557(-)
MSSLYSECSSLRCSVASATCLSKALIPASRAEISSVSVASPSCALAMACSSSEMVRSKDFLLSSLTSSCFWQYSNFSSSSLCSFFKTVIMSSHILMTLSKPPRLTAFLPVSASARRSKPGSSPWLEACRALRITATARARRCDTSSRTCTKLALAALGKVFLNSSSASSWLRTLMVSAKATSSSARVFLRSSHSAVFVSQFFSRSARNFWSSSKAASVSARSSFICTMATPISPIWLVFISIE